MMMRHVLATAGVLTLTACGGASKPAAQESSAPASPATSSAVTISPAATADTPSRGDTPTREFVVGKWGTDGDCTLAVDLRADGTSDGPFGNWSYADGTISFADAPEFKVTVTVLDDATMESHNEGKTTKMTRCP